MDLRKQWKFGCGDIRTHKYSRFGWVVNFGRDAANRRVAWAVIWLQVSPKRLRYWYPGITLPRWL